MCRVDTDLIDIRDHVKFRRDTPVDAEEFAIQQAYDGQCTEGFSACIIHPLAVLVEACLYALECRVPMKGAVTHILA